jgi:hypothetical protein
MQPGRDAPYWPVIAGRFSKCVPFALRKTVGSIARFNPTAFQAVSFQLYDNGGMAEYQHSVHATYDLKYHVI